MNGSTNTNTDRIERHAPGHRTRAPHGSVPIQGCQSRVWIDARYEDGKVWFTADSDAIITKGIIALLIRVLGGRTPQEILDTDLYFIDAIGPSANLSPTRSNGLLAMIKQMRLYALAFSKKITLTQHDTRRDFTGRKRYRRHAQEYLRPRNPGQYLRPGADLRNRLRTGRCGEYPHDPHRPPTVRWRTCWSKTSINRSPKSRA